MIKAYINYPQPHVTLHYDPGCGSIQSHRKLEQRRLRIDIANLSTRLQEFERRDYRFTATPEGNDMWLEVDFQDADFELAVIHHLCQLLAPHYTPIAAIPQNRHC